MYEFSIYSFEHTCTKAILQGCTKVQKTVHYTAGKYYEK